MPHDLHDDVHNRRLVSLTGPPDRVNPPGDGRYNLVVLGGGTAGLVTAAGAALMGARVALVERAFLGGDCLVFGCVPSKALIRSAKAAADVRRAAQFGVHIDGEVRVDFAAVMDRVRARRADISPHDSVTRFEDEFGVEVFLGEGRFISPDRLRVGDRTLAFKKAVIATGCRPALPPIDGLADVNPLTNEGLFELTELPRRLVVLGGGPIGCELAQAMARLGSTVTLVELADRVLPRDDPDAAALVQAALEADGVSLRLGRGATRAWRIDGVTRLSLQGGEELHCDRVLVATGRLPNVEGLGLESVGVAFDRRAGVTVNRHLQTTQPTIYAAGDVAWPQRFTHAAEATARIVVRNALFPGSSSTDGMTLPWVTYTDPEVAHVGLGPVEAREQGVELDTWEATFDHVDRAIVDGDTTGFVRLHTRRGSDTLVGATIVHRHAGEIMAEVTLAVTAGIGLKELSNVIHPYPTLGDGVKQAVSAWSRGRLTPGIQAGLRRVFRLTR